MKRLKIVAAAVACIAASAIEKKKKKRSLWMKKWLKRRAEVGSFNQICAELRSEDQVSFSNYLRMPPYLFQHLLDLVTPVIKKSYTSMREPISPGMKT